VGCSGGAGCGALTATRAAEALGDFSLAAEGSRSQARLRHELRRASPMIPSPTTFIEELQPSFARGEAITHRRRPAPEWGGRLLRLHSNEDVAPLRQAWEPWDSAAGGHRGADRLPAAHVIDIDGDSRIRMNIGDAGRHDHLRT